MQDIDITKGNDINNTTVLAYELIGPSFFLIIVIFF